MTPSISDSAEVQKGNSGGPDRSRRDGSWGVKSKLDAIKTSEATSDLPQNVNFATKSLSSSSWRAPPNPFHLTTKPSRTNQSRSCTISSDPLSFRLSRIIETAMMTRVMSQELFADRIGDITVANGMVRIEFRHSRRRTGTHKRLNLPCPPANRPGRIVQGNRRTKRGSSTSSSSSLRTRPRPLQ